MDNSSKYEMIVYRDEPTTKSQIGVTQNKIVEILNFLDADTCDKVIKYLEDDPSKWGDIAFYGSFGMGIDEDNDKLASYGLESDFFTKLKERYKDAVSTVFGRPVKANTAHAQKWEVGGFATAHSDNSDFDGNPTPFEINKYVSILYLNDEYTGGDLYFTGEDILVKTISIFPKKGSLCVFPGGIENIHGVDEVLSGSRYTLVSFWDFAEAEYSEDRKAWWAQQYEIVEREKEIAREEWAKGNKWA